jgi:hypothetical protein
MKRTTLTQGVVVAVAAWMMTSPASARQGENRLTDKAVTQIIESVEKGRNTFESKIDDKVKSSILRSPRGELRVDAYLDDLEVNVKNLKSRFDKTYSASSEAETVLRQASIIDGFVKNFGQDMKGASEWDALAIELRRLASAYSTTFPLAPTGGTVRRINDAEAGAAADDMKRHAKKMRDSIDGNAGLSKEARDGVKANLHALEEQADLVKSRMNSGQPASAEMRKLLEQISAVDRFMAANKVMPATQAAWQEARVPLDKLKQAYDVKAPRP